MGRMVRAPGAGRRDGDGDRGTLMLQQRPSALAYAKQALSSLKQRGALDADGSDPPVVFSRDECLRIAKALIEAEELPIELAAKVLGYVSQAAPSIRKKRRRGPKRQTLRRRNSAIIRLINEIREEYGLDATRNKATEADSAASIVSKALRQLGVRQGSSESRINTIYKAGIGQFGNHVFDRLERERDRRNAQLERELLEELALEAEG